MGMFDYDALDEDIPKDRKPAASPAKGPKQRPGDEPDWEAPAPAGWWRVVSEKGLWTTADNGDILDWFWKDEVIAGKSYGTFEDGIELLWLRDDGGKSQKTMVRGPLLHLDGTRGAYGHVLEPLPVPVPAEARAAHARVVEERRTRGRLARNLARKTVAEARAEEEVLTVTAKLLPDVKLDSREHAGLLTQARVLSAQSFPRRFDAQDFMGTQHLTILTHSKGTNVVGYCFYLLPIDRYLWVEQVVVERKFRGKGLGKLLMRWAMEEADRRGCWAVRLSALVSAVPFYRALGFQDYHADADFKEFKRTSREELRPGQEEAGWPMHVRLPQHRKPKSLVNADFYPFQYAA